MIIMHADTLTFAGYLAIGGLVLIPVGMIAWVAVALIRQRREDRAAESRRVKLNVPEFGVLSSTDNELWTGCIGGLRLFIATRGGPPTALQISQTRTLVDQLPRLTETARAYLSAQADCADLDGDAAQFRACTLAVEVDTDTASGANDFVLELEHSADPYGVYRVSFEHGEPVAFGRDD